MTLSDFRMAKTETTVWQYQLFARGTGRPELLRKPNEWEWMGNTPAVYVSWFDAIAYANWLSERFGWNQHINWIPYLKILITWP